MFTKAITRKPCKALIDGITTAMFGEGTPNYETAIKQHDNYVETLRSLGLEVLDLEADERYPDSCFVEDPAVVMAECAIITNPATDSRNGEKYEIVDAIKKFYSDDQIFHIETPGTMEGGDVMLVEKHFYVLASLTAQTQKDSGSFRTSSQSSDTKRQRYLLQKDCT